MSFIDGDQLNLCPQTPDHYNLYLKWWNNPFVRRYGRSLYPTTLEQLKKMMEESKSPTPEAVFFEVTLKSENIPIGDVGLHHISWPDGTAHIGLSIGEDAYRSKGYGSEAARLILQYGFEELNMYKIFAEIFYQISDPNGQPKKWECT